MTYTCCLIFFGVKKFHGGGPRPNKCFIKLVYTKYHQSCNKRRLNCRIVTTQHTWWYGSQKQGDIRSWVRGQNYSYQTIVYTTVPFSFWASGPDTLSLPFVQRGLHPLCWAASNGSRYCAVSSYWRRCGMLREREGTHAPSKVLLWLPGGPTL